MKPDDIRERDRLLKALRRKPVDPLAPPKPTTPELMQRLAGGMSDEYSGGAEGRAAAAKTLWDMTGKDKRAGDH